jgi:tetratricopeptide (TPR) repeat protein
MPKKISKKVNDEIKIKVKKTKAHETFWEGVDFEKEPKEKTKEKTEQPKLKKIQKTKINQPKKLKKINKSKYILFILLGLILISFFYLFFITRPNLSHNYEQKADLELANKDKTYALQDYQKALVLNPRNSNIYVKIAKIYQEKNLFDEAKKYAQESINLDPNNKGAYLLLGKNNLKNYNYDSAYQDFKKVLDKDTDNADAYIGLLEALIAQNKIKEAENISQKALLIYPDNLKIIFERSLVWFMGKDYEKAQEGFEKLSKTDNQAMLEKAKIALNTISKLKSSNSAPYQKALIGNFYNQMGFPTLGIINFNQALINNNSYRDAYLGLAESYLAEKNYQESEKNVKKALEIDPVSGLGYYILGKGNQEQKLIDKALVNYKKALIRGYDNAAIRKNLAEIYLDKKDYQNALNEYGKSLIFTQNNLETYDKIVWLLGQKLNKPKEAIEKAIEAEKIEPQKALTYNILAKAYLANNEFDLAHKSIDKAINTDPEFAQNYYTLALIYQREGNLEEAKKYFTLAADLDQTGNIFNLAYEQLKNL